MGDRLGTPGVVDFRLFSQILTIAVVAATSNGGSKLKTRQRQSRRLQIKKSKLILVTAFKVGFHFFFFGFRLSIFGWAGILLINETSSLQEDIALLNLRISPSFDAKFRKTGSTPPSRQYRMSTAIPR